MKSSMAPSRRPGAIVITRRKIGSSGRSSRAQLRCRASYLRCVAGSPGGPDSTNLGDQEADYSHFRSVSPAQIGGERTGHEAADRGDPLCAATAGMADDRFRGGPAREISMMSGLGGAYGYYRGIQGRTPSSRTGLESPGRFRAACVRSSKPFGGDLPRGREIMRLHRGGARERPKKEFANCRAPNKVVHSRISSRPSSFGPAKITLGRSDTGHIAPSAFSQLHRLIAAK